METFNKKYLDIEPGDVVVGVIAQRTSEYLRVDIGTAELGMLKLLNFQGATKRSKPDIYPGDLVIAKVLESSSVNSEPFLTCVNARTGKSDGLGVITGGGSIDRPGILSGMVAATQVLGAVGLEAAGNNKPNSSEFNPNDPSHHQRGDTKKGSDCDGFAIWMSLSLCRRLLATESTILQSLGKSYSFEIAIGMNGYVWLNGGTIEKTIGILNAIESFEFVADDVIEEHMKSIYS